MYIYTQRTPTYIYNTYFFIKYKAEEESKKKGKLSGQRPTKRQPLDNTFLQSRTE